MVSWGTIFIIQLNRYVQGFHGIQLNNAAVEGERIRLRRISEAGDGMIAVVHDMTTA